MRIPAAAATAPSRADASAEVSEVCPGLQLTESRKPCAPRSCAGAAIAAGSQSSALSSNPTTSPLPPRATAAAASATTIATPTLRLRKCASLERRAIHLVGAHLRDRPLEGRERTLRSALAPEDPRLPAAQVGVVPEQVVEERADVGLTVGQLERVLDLRALIRRGRARVRVSGLAAAGVRRHQARDVLLEPVEVPLRGVDGGLEAALHVPDQRAAPVDAAPRDRLLRAGERVLESRDELRPVALGDHRAGVLAPGSLRRCGPVH